jgi:hypothetical protein
METLAILQQVLEHCRMPEKKNPKKEMNATWQCDCLTNLQSQKK